jgi:TRAP-type C4-dicarboxylate transport system permease small subunit
MGRLIRTVLKLAQLINVIAGGFLTLMMLLTVADVILRSFRRPILGTYELVSFAGAIVIGFALPLTSWTKGHIYVDMILEKFPKPLRKFFDTCTKLMGFGFFLISGWMLIKVGMKIHQTGEVSFTLHMPIHPIAYGLGICCFIQCLVYLCDIVKIHGGEHE